MKIRNHYERIIGGTPEEKEVAAQELQTYFDKTDQEMAKYEVEKSSEDLEIIKKTETLVDQMVAQYGGNPKPLPLDHIYVLKPGSVLTMSDGKIVEGVFCPYGLKVGVEQEKSKLLFTSILAHELFHLKSYKSALVGRSGEGALLYRSGLNLIDRKNPDEKEGEGKEYFGELEEAVVAECTKKFIDKISQDKTFSEEVTGENIMAVNKLSDWAASYYRRRGMSEEKIQELKKELKYIYKAPDLVKEVSANYNDENDRQAYAAGIINGLYDAGKIEMLERYPERQKMYKLFDKLIAGSAGRFKNRDEVFTEFAKANFSGNYLPLARMVEGILGEGSFRKIAEEFSKKPNKEGTEITPE